MYRRGTDWLAKYFTSIFNICAGGADCESAKLSLELPVQETRTEGSKAPQQILPKVLPGTEDALPAQIIYF